MKEQLFNEYALYWAGGFMVVYVLAQLLVSRHSRFQFLSPIQKSVTVKVIALCGFVLAYLAIKLVS
ncbi:MAG TPA: hypothetical protein VL995_06745 [Cellvibrio sp.]|nr:hypothetical protein [Cellvibrio sp.]